MLQILLFLFGGLGYGCLEILWRGYTHPSMILTGGVCFSLICFISKIPSVPTIAKAFLCCVAVTLIEYAAGYIVNIRLGLCVWDYSALPFNIKGQVCLMYSALWFLLSLFLVPLCKNI